jgi:hypothetical protein
MSLRYALFHGRTFAVADLAATALCLAALWAPAKADPVEDFYRGKTVDLSIGYTPSQAYYLYARLVAQFTGDHILGKPHTHGGSSTPASKNSHVISALDFAGVDPTGASDSDAGFANFIAACMTGGNCITSCGTYKFANDLTFDFASNQAGGIHFQGSGQNCTLPEFASEHGVKIINSANVGFFYPVFDNFGVLANNKGGAAFQVGQNSFADAANGLALRDLWIKNLANSHGSQGLKFNEVYSYTVDNVTTSDGCTSSVGDCPSGGDSFQLNQSAFGTLHGSFSGGYSGLYFTQGYNFGIQVLASDLEVNYYDVIFDSTITLGHEPANITFTGGQSGFYNYAMLSTEGGSLVLDNPTFSPATGALRTTPTDGTVANAQGILIRDGSLGLNVSTPSFPPSKIRVYNTTLRRVLVTVYGGTISQYCFGPSTGSCVTPPSGIGSYMLNPNDETIVTYSGSAGWTWQPTE